jgi:hypothetical protein
MTVHPMLAKAIGLGSARNVADAATTTQARTPGNSVRVWAGQVEIESAVDMVVTLSSRGPIEVLELRSHRWVHGVSFPTGVDWSCDDGSSGESITMPSSTCTANFFACSAGRPGGQTFSRLKVSGPEASAVQGCLQLRLSPGRRSASTLKSLQRDRRCAALTPKPCRYQRENALGAEKPSSAETYDSGLCPSTAGSFEGNPKWQTISRNQEILNYGAQQAIVNNPEMFNRDCSGMPLVAYLADHKAETLQSVLGVVERFIKEHPTDPARERSFAVD